MDLSRRVSDPWGNEVAVLLESIGSNDSEGVIIGEKRTVAREEAVTNILGVFQNNYPLLIKSPPMSGKTSMANLISHRLKTTAREKCLILKVSMLNLTRHGTGRRFESAFEEEVRVKWGDLPRLARNRKIYLIFDEVQVLYRRPAGDRPVSPKFNSDVFWTMVKSIMVDHSSGSNILLFSCYESNSESSLLATPVKFTMKSMLGINWLNFSDADLKDYVHRNLLARDGIDDLSLDLFCTNLKRITAGHVGFCYAAVDFLNGILASQRRSGTLTVKHVLKSLDDSRLFTHLRETYAFDGAKNSSLGIKQQQIADFLVLKGVFVEHGVVNLQYVFSSPVMRRFFTEMVFGVPAERAQKNPDTLDDLVYAIVSSIDYEHIKSSLGKTKKNGILLERAWQMEFYKASHQCTSDYVTSVDVGGLFGTPGAIDVTVQSDDMEVFWGIELLREGIRLEDHVGRFKNGGRYEVMCRMFSETCVLDIRRQPKGTAPNLEDLDKYENLMIFTYDESFSEGALYSKSCCFLLAIFSENPELAKLIQADSPILVKQIYSIVEGMKSAKDKLMELQQRISSNLVPTSKGVSLLEIKLHGLLSYLTNLSFFILLKLHGQSTSELHPSVELLIEMRVILEKIKPMEVKLKYQIDKVLKAANDASNPSAEKNAQRNVSEFDLQNSGLSDPLQFQAESVEFSGCIDCAEDGGVYRPPRIAPVKYSEEPKRRKGDLSASTRESLSKSRLFKDMRDTLDTSRPEQVTSHGTGYGVCELRDSKDEELAMIEEFELSNYQRLSATRDRNKREKAAMRKGGAAGIVDEMENLESDFLQMDALDRAVSFDNQERYGSSGSVLAKRNMRAESFFTGNDEPRKKGKFTDATELVTKVASGAAGKKTAYDKALRKASKPRHRTLAKK
ncbi:hypothetical protein HDU80_000681 [Chytriomyces hyalinus]|nr:hypothetical protein HDU80_000681 [Chytriomyces hyalinus]